MPGTGCVASSDSSVTPSVPCELPPKLRVRRRRVQLFVEIFLHDGFQVAVAIGAAGEVLQVFRERSDVLVVLLGVQVPAAASKASLPSTPGKTGA